MSLIKLGTIVKAIGLEGEVLVSGMPIGIFLPLGSVTLIGYSEHFAEQYVLQEGCQATKHKVLLKLVNVDAPDVANNLKEKAIFVDKESVLTNNPNYVFEEDIINCDVFDNATGQFIGKIIEVWYLPANNVWLTQSSFGDIPLPVIDDVIIRTEFSNKKIWINLLDGLIDIALK